MAAPRESPNGSVRELSPEEGRRFFDRRARALLGISGAEFLQRWDAGEYRSLADDPEHPEIMTLAMLSDFGR